MKITNTFKTANIILITVAAITAIMFYLRNSEADSSNILDRVSQRLALENKARNLAEVGNLDGAIKFYKEAMESQYIDYDYDKNTSLASIREIYKWKGEYEKALVIINEMLGKSPNAVYFLMEKKEIEALVLFTKSKDKKYIYGHIDKIREEYKNQLPPVKYLPYSVMYISDILRLYDTIGDHDAGIAFIDEILAYFRTGKAGDPKPGRVDAEYMKVREAFELDKKECAKGRATQALIQSDYFPW
jgi:tetratricopeptide (TPR) repeat protein